MDPEESQGIYPGPVKGVHVGGLDLMKVSRDSRVYFREEDSLPKGPDNLVQVGGRRGENYVTGR